MPLPLTPAPDQAVASVARVVQTALTPIFLLSGIGTLLGLFNTRLARVSDQIQHADDLLKSDPEDGERRAIEGHVARLMRRVFVLDASIALGAVGGAATCGSVFILFLGSVREGQVAGWLIGLFGLALACTIGSLMAFLADSLLAWRGMREEGPVPRSLKSNRTT